MGIAESCMQLLILKTNVNITVHAEVLSYNCIVVH